MGRSRLTDDIRWKVLTRLRKHVERKYIGRYGVKDIVAYFKGRYLYIDWIEDGCLTHSPRKTRPSRLCRLKYTGDADCWLLEVYKYSDDCYDAEEDVTFGGGTVRECFDEAARVYIT